MGRAGQGWRHLPSRKQVEIVIHSVRQTISLSCSCADRMSIARCKEQDFGVRARNVAKGKRMQDADYKLTATKHARQLKLRKSHWVGGNEVSSRV